ncbi:transglycosylase domain-containing protein [Desulfosporosinus sp. SB140]|uniref:transglycosylase domain-containing protein n=1 Tax=Desulfosporosinus paludis TaxID=3115649 RepID=UPI0038900768
MKSVAKRMFGVLILAFATLFIGWHGLKYYFMHVNRISSQVRNNVLMKIQAQHSQFLSYNEIPKIYREAVIATEDRSFSRNKGIDLKGTLRAVKVDISREQPLQGGSTITQQLIHNTLLVNTSKSLMWKLIESVYAIGLYDTMSKQETFSFYANVIYFGQGANGLYQAAEIYFGRPPSKLNAGELTMLAGIPNAPSDYDPYSNIALARERQHIVIQCLVDSGVINESQAQQILSEPINLKDSRPSTNKLKLALV